MRHASIFYSVLALLLVPSLQLLAQTEPEINQRPIAEVTSVNGTITTVAGNGTYGYSGDGSKATLAELRYPTAVAFDKDGNYYIADWYTCLIRKVDIKTGVISSVVGNVNKPCGYSGDGGQASLAQLNFPVDIKFDSAWNLYIADSLNNVVRKVDTQGVITTVAGTGTAGYNGDGGKATQAALSGPDGLALDKANNLYIAESFNKVIRQVVAQTGIIHTFVGTGVQGYSGDGSAATAAEMSDPGGIAFDAAGDLYIADQGNFAVRKVDTKGIITTVAGTGVQGGFTPGVAACNGGVAKSTALSEIPGVTVDTSGNLYFANDFYYGSPYGFSTVCKLDAKTGKLAILAGKAGNAYSGDGALATNAQLNIPGYLTFDAAGSLYIADTFNQRIRKVTFPSAATASPNFSPASGTYSGTTSVTITDATAGAVIYYTTNGTTPTTSSPQYGGSIAVTENTTIEAIAIAPGYTQSPVVTAKYVIQATSPTFTPLAGSYLGTQNITIADATTGAVIHYTVDGSIPTAASKIYSAPIPVSVSMTVKAIAVATNFGASPVVSASYTIYVGTTATPVISPAGGIYGTEQTVTFTDTTPGAAFYYTLNGTTPTSASTKYTVPINIASSLTLKAIAIAPNYANSLAASAAYVIAGTPTALNGPATAITSTGATLNALVSPLGVAGTYFFAYGTGSTTADLTSFTASAPFTATTARLAVKAALTGKLKTKTPYYYQVVVTTVGGTSASAILSFTTK